MSSFFAKRLFQALIAVFGVMTLIFFLQRLAGDPVLLLVPMDATQADIDRMRVALGFDQPLIRQYLDFMGNLIRFDLGRSYVQNIPVIDLIWTRIPYTLMLAGGALVVAFGIGIPIGVTLAVRRGRPIARVLSALVLAGQSMPTFWSAILMIMVFGVWLGWAHAVRRAGGFKHHHAVDRPWPALAGDIRSRGAHGRARRAGKGLCPHGPCQGPAHAPHHFPAPAAQRLHSGRHRRSAGNRQSSGWGRHR